jgi:hypothetical protein
MGTSLRPVETVEKWTADSFRALLRGDRLALRVPQFADEPARRHWKRALKDPSRFSRYANAPDVEISTVGMTLFETQNEHERLQAYFQVAEQFEERMARLFSPRPSPFALIQRRLADLWPAGGQPGMLHGRAMCPGIIRKFEQANSDGLPPHQDMLHKDVSPSNEAASDLQAQVAVNLYIEVPERGGELELWDVRLSDEEREALLSGEHDFIDRSVLPEPEALRPRDGELILFRSDRVHAVRGMRRENRMAASCFLGYYGNDEPIRYWA